MNSDLIRRSDLLEKKYLIRGRLAASPNHEDSWVDLVGYAACGAELACRGGAV